MSENLFETLQAVVVAGGPEAAFDQLATEMRQKHRYHDLFDARLMQARYRLGLPVISSTMLDELPESMREKLEEAYLVACREVGELLLAENKFREAWMYLRPVGDKSTVAAALDSATPEDDTLEEMIEVSLHEGVSPVRGFQLVLENYGTCNAITTFEGTIPNQSRACQVAAATMLVNHLYKELLANVRSHIEDRSGPPAAEATLAELVQANEWIFENDNYHIDTSHLSSTVRFARLIEDDQETLRKAWGLTEYGRRLGEQFRFAGDEPFAEMYPSHGLLFAATLGERVDEALAYFRDKAETVNVEIEGTAAIETYLILLDRLGRYERALEAHAKLVLPGMHLSPYAPRLFDLAKRADKFDRFMEISRERSDVLSFAAGLVQGR
jgi:hypothetical protein